MIDSKGSAGRGVPSFEDGICSARISPSIAEGLGLRWSFMGPFETIDLNSPTGIEDIVKILDLIKLAQEQADPRVWGEALLSKVEQERRDLAADKLLDRHWRNQRLALLMSARKVRKDLENKFQMFRWLYFYCKR